MIVPVLSVAFAADPNPALLMPSAVPVEAGASHVGVSWWGTTSFGSVTSGPAIQGGYAVTDQLYVQAAAVGGTDHFDLGAGAMVAARALAVDLPGFHVAPFVGALALHVEDGSGVYVVPGLALDAGGRRVRWDLSVGVPLRTAEFDDWYTEDMAMATLVATETGLSVALDEAEVHTVRGSSNALFVPGVTYRYDQEWFVEASVRAMPALVGVAHLEVGRSW